MEGSSAIYLAIDEPIGCLLVPVLGCKKECGAKVLKYISC